MPFPKIDSDLLDTGTVDGKIPLIGAGDKLANALIDTGSVNGKIPLVGAGDKLPTSLLDVGNGANQLVQLDGSAKLPAIDASLLTNLPAPSGGVGAWKLIETVVANGVAQADFTTGIDGTYKEYVIRGNNITLSTSSNLVFRVRVAGVFRTGAEYTYGGDGTSNQQGILSFANANGAYYLIIPSGVMPNDGNGNTSFDLSITNPAGTTATKALRSNAGGSNASYNGGFSCQSGGRWFGASTSAPLDYSALDGFRLMGSTGSISGTFKLYGLL